MGAALILAARLPGAAIPSPPPAVPRPVQDTYFGTTVTDPYRYFEKVKTDVEVQAWFKAQADYTRAVLDSIPGRATLLKRKLELANATPAHVSDLSLLPGRIFYEERSADEIQYSLYTRAGWDGPAELLVDIPKLNSPDGTPAGINFYLPSPNGRYLAYTYCLGGSEEIMTRVLEVATRKDMGIALPNSRVMAWRDDESGFYYLQIKDRPKDAPRELRYQELQMHYHAMGKEGAKDPVVFGTEAPGGVDIAPAETPSISLRYGDPRAFAIVGNGTQNEFALYASTQAKLDAGKQEWRKLFGFDDGVIDYAIHGDDLYVVSHKSALRGELLRTTVSAPDLTKAEVVIPPGEAVVESVGAARDSLYIKLLDGGIERLQRLDYAAGSKPQEIVLPIVGSVYIVSNQRLDGVALWLVSWVNAGGIYTYDPATEKTTDTLLSPHGRYDQPADLVAEEVHVPSYDGTMIPMSIIYRKGLKFDGSNPCELTAYGAYGIADTPGFGPSSITWYERGGINAIAHVRGGGAYGEEWHVAGMKQTKPNTWKDLIACAQWLIDHKYTSTPKLGILGGSAGGITVGRAMTERPDLFAAVVAEVGLMNPLRFEEDANGVLNIPEFGSVKNAEEFPALLEMDSYLHIKDGVKYPPTLVTTGMNDPRVPPWQEGKFAARLEQAGAPLVLLRVDYEAGHGMVSTIKQGYEQSADCEAFLLWQFGEPGFQPK
jgi:prolyl oligopeptidase